jgi:2-haloacid dehalogenase
MVSATIVDGMEFDGVVFDVLGTVVDEDAALRRAAADLLEPAHLDAAEVESFARRWEACEAELMDAIGDGARSWSTHDVIRSEALRDVVERLPHDGLSSRALDEAASFGRRIEPFAESVKAVTVLRRDHRVIALTNGTRATMIEMSDRAGLEWTRLISADEVRAFKPSPLMYEQARVGGGLEPGRTLFVAAHPWDLDAAETHGFRTALVLRPGVPSSAGRYDYEVRDLSEIADLLTASAS